MTQELFKQRKRFVLVLVVIGLFVVITMLGIILNFFPASIGFLSYCDERSMLNPGVPISTNATLVDETMPHDTPNSAVLIRGYRSDSRPGEIADFYREIASCNVEPTSNKLQCFGEAEPFGVYTVLIDNESEQTTEFSVEIRWDRCSSNESISIENH